MPQKHFPDLQSEATPLKYPVALVIGITSFESMTREDAQGYADALGRGLTELRQKNVPVIWGVIAAGGNRLIIPPDSEDRRPQDFQLLMEMGFDETEGGHGTNSDIHFKFLQEHGPRRNEVIYRRPTKDTLLDPDDVKAFGPAYEQELLAEAGVKLESQRSPADPPGMRYTQRDQADSEFMKFFNDQTLANFLGEKNADGILVMGAMAEFCVVETGISAALKDYDTTLAVNRVLGWDRLLTTVAERRAASMVWQNSAVSVDHGGRMREKINLIIDDPVRALTSEQKAKIRGIKLQEFDEFINRVTIQEGPRENPPRPRRSRRAPPRGKDR